MGHKEIQDPRKTVIRGNSTDRPIETGGGGLQISVEINLLEIETNNEKARSNRTLQTN